MKGPSYYSSNGHTASNARLGSALPDRAVRLDSAVDPQGKNAALCDVHDRNLQVELKAILTVQRAISREIEAGRLIETLLTLAVELVGAERGLLFLARGQEYQIEAEATTQGGSVQVASVADSTILPRFPRSVLRYVLRTEDSVVLEDAMAENQFSEDDYLQGGQIRSILSLPLVARRKLIGALYLENNRAPQAFAPERLAALELLALQAASSLTTAALVVDLKHQVSELKKAEDRLACPREVYREAPLDACAALMGGLTAVLAHELNQPLAAIQSNAHGVRRLLNAQKSQPAKANAAIEDIIQDISRAVEIVRNVRSIFQRDTAGMTRVNLLQILHDVARSLRADAAQRGIIIRLDLPTSLPDVTGNRTQLFQVMMNLILNAFEAMDERPDGDGTGELVLSAGQRESRFVHVGVRDSGRGIDPEIIPQLFKWFFTTKPNGIGMGLAIVRSIIENHHGRLQVKSNPERGATVEFDLPIGS